VGVTQIPEFFPEISLSKLKNDEELLTVLSPEVLAKAAKLFGVKLGWLQGLDEQIYDTLHCYKQPDLFFEDLAMLDRKYHSFPFHVLCDSELDNHDDRTQRIVLLFEEEIRQLNGEPIYRYQVFGDGWDWSHPNCRIQLKAMVRLYYQCLHRPIPLHRVTPSLLTKIEEGKLIPTKVLGRCALTEPAFEDYAMSVVENSKAKETEELPVVIEYINGFRLDDVPKRLLI
jgi:hypothetical protein